MRRMFNRILMASCITASAVTTATSVPLFILYLKGETVRILVVEDLHVWFGIVFIVFALLRISLNRRFVAGSLKQLFRKNRNVSRISKKL